MPYRRIGMGLFAAASLLFAAPSSRAEMCFIALLDGAQAGTPSPGTGVGHFLLNDDETALTYKITFSGLGSTETASHIHSDAEGGAALKNTGTGATKIGEWTSADTVPLTPARVADLKAGLLYHNIHSANFPAGEIRGQILPAPCEEQCFEASIDGQMTGTPGSGFAKLALNHTETELAYWVEFSGLTATETAAHIHNRAEAGAAVRTLGTGSPKSGVWKWNDAVPLTGARVKNLKTGMMYVNIHTSAFPTGEIDGDIFPGSCQPECYAALLDGAQAGTGSLATGQGYFQLSHAHNRLTFDVTTSGIVGETGAHIHSDSEGGGVVRNIGTGMSKSGQWDYDDASPLSMTRVIALKAGALYVNVHTTSFPGGEIRGQMNPIVCGTTAVDDAPRATALLRNYPNPFNPATTIAFALTAPAHVRLDVFAVSGAHVATLIDGPREAGYGEAVWNGVDAGGRPVASGVYFYRLTTAGFTATHRMVLLK